MPLLTKKGHQSSCSKDCNDPCKVHMGSEYDEDALDIIGQVLAKRMSRGGMVANKQGPGVDELPNEFDDLALRDDLESSYTGANSGDELGNEGEDERRADMVMRAMLKRKKQHNPRPA